jgi:hypothetical protein
MLGRWLVSSKHSAKLFPIDSGACVGWISVAHPPDWLPEGARTLPFIHLWEPALPTKGPAPAPS